MKKIKINFKRRGFTLIELLAVILILGVIALIAVPTITSGIEDSKKAAIKSTADILVDAVEKQCQVEQMKGQTITDYYIIRNGVISSSLDIKNLPDSGSIKVDDECNAEVMVSDGTYCAIKEGEQVTVTSNISDCQVVTVTPEACFVFDTSTKTITNYNYDGTTCTHHVSIPSTINGIAVEKIGDVAFGQKNLTSLVMTDSVVEIGVGAFYSNNLKSVILSKNITTIGDYAFAMNQIEKIEIPANITTIGEAVFLYNQLSEIEIPKGVTTIGYGAFSINQLVSVAIPNSVTSIGGSAFAYNQLESILLPEGVTSIGNYAFSNNLLTNVVIPDTVTTIEGYAFTTNKIETLKISSSLVELPYAVFANNLLKSVEIPSGITTIDGYAFADNQLKSVTIPSTVTSIGYRSFINNELESLIIPEGVVSIGSFAFAHNKIASLTLASTIVTLSGGAFNDNQLEEDQAFIYERNYNTSVNKIKLVSYGGADRDNVVIPSNIQRIQSYAFYDVGLRGITIPKSVNVIGFASFALNELPEGQEFIYARNEDGTIDETKIAAYGGANKDNVVIPSTVTTIGSYSFVYNNIKSVTIPKTVTTIEYGAFNSNLLPEGQEFIYARKEDGTIDDTTLVSYGGAKRSNVEVPSTVTNINLKTFGHCMISSITIPSTVTSIGESAFEVNDSIRITINRSRNAISGSPWGATSASVNWTGSN